MPLRNPTFLQACRGERPAHTPLWVMRQAGRYLPEYREVRAKVSFETLCRTPELCAKVTLQPVERFDLDAAILFSDILVVFDAMGVEVTFDPAPVVRSPLRTRADLDALHFGPPAEHLGYVFDAVRACKEALADRVPLIGFCGAPLTTASYLIEGETSRDFRHTKTMAFAEPELFDRLLGSITDLLVDYLRLQVQAGADALQIFESWAGAFSPTDYRRYAAKHTRRLVEGVGDLGVPVILFARGNANLLEEIADFPATVFGIDWSIELDRALDVLGRDKVVQGNLDPMALFAPPEVLADKARRIVEIGKTARGHIFNLGHGIDRHTDPDAVARLVDIVRSAS